MLSSPLNLPKHHFTVTCHLVDQVRKTANIITHYGNTRLHMTAPNLGFVTQRLHMAFAITLL